MREKVNNAKEAGSSPSKPTPQNEANLQNEAKPQNKAIRRKSNDFSGALSHRPQAQQITPARQNKAIGRNTSDCNEPACEPLDPGSDPRHELGHDDDREHLHDALAGD